MEKDDQTLSKNETPSIPRFLDILRGSGEIRLLILFSAVVAGFFLFLTIFMELQRTQVSVRPLWEAFAIPVSPLIFFLLPAGWWVLVIRRAFREGREVQGEVERRYRSLLGTGSVSVTYHDGSRLRKVNIELPRELRLKQLEVGDSVRLVLDPKSPRRAFLKTAFLPDATDLADPPIANEIQSIEFDLTREDLGNQFFLFLELNRWIGVLCNTFLGILALFALLGFIIVLLSIGLSGRISVLLAALGVLAAGFIAKAGVKSMLAAIPLDSSPLLGSRIVELMTEGVREQGDHGVRHHYWSAIDRIWISERYVVLSISRAELLQIPRRAFPEPGHAVAFVEKAKSLKRELERGES